MGLFGKKTTEKPNFETSYLGFWIRVFPNRVEFKSGPGSQNIPITQIASIQVGMVGLMQIIIETTGGKKYKIPTLKKKEAKDAIYAAQSAFTSDGSNHDSASVADEIAKLAALREQGILSEDEFEVQKKKLLG